MKCNTHSGSSESHEPHESHFCISQVPIFCHLSPEEMAEVDKVTVNAKYQKGEMIFLSGDPLENLFIINKGKVKISRISEFGREQILRILQPGEFMGELSLFGDSPLTSNAETLEPTEVCLIKKRDMEKLVLKFPNIALKVLSEFSARLEMAENLIEQLGLHDVEQRVAGILVQLAKSAKEEPNGEVEVTLTMSKRDLASFIGTTQETLSRKLSSFQEKGWIKLQGHRKIVILDRNSLQQIVSAYDE